MMLPKVSIRSALLLAVLIGGIFLICTRPGLQVGFDNDDVMNLYSAWRPPLAKLVMSNLAPFTSFNRPLGAAYYRICYTLFGWRPTAFRIVTYLFMLGNLYLVYRLSCLLTRDREIGALSALLYAFHGHLRQVYLSNGTVYDVLCTTFTLLTLCYYIRVRQAGARWRLHHLAVLLILFTAALNAKEMAATLPALLLLYEWLFHGPTSIRPKEVVQWMWRRAPVPLLTLCLAAAAFWGKTQPGSSFYQQPLYVPSFTFHRALQNERVLLAELLYRSSCNTTFVALFYTGLFAVAAITKKRHLWFGAFFALLTPLPILFLPYRGFFVMYLPLVGFVVYLGAVLVEGRNWLLARIWARPKPPENSWWQPEQVFLFLYVATFLPFGRNIDAQTTLAVTDPSVRYIQQMHADLLNLNKPLPRGARILLLHSPYPEDAWGPLMMMQLKYQDRDLRVDRPALPEQSYDGALPAKYDRVIDYDGTNLFVVQRGPRIPRSEKLPDS